VAVGDPPSGSKPNKDSCFLDSGSLLTTCPWFDVDLFLGRHKLMLWVCDKILRQQSPQLLKDHQI
jgi:hypothetical protein